MAPAGSNGIPFPSAAVFATAAMILAATVVVVLAGTPHLGGAAAHAVPGRLIVARSVDLVVRIGRDASPRVGGRPNAHRTYGPSQRTRDEISRPLRVDVRGTAARRAQSVQVGLPPEGADEVVPEAMVAFLTSHEIRHGDPGRGVVALTFDCGYGPDATREILRTLADLGVRATFFLEGRFIEAYPEVVVRIVAGGHEVANHSTTHPDFTDLTAAEIADELATADELMEDALTERRVKNRPTTHYFRFPFGARDGSRLAAVAQSGYQSVFWSLDPKGWQIGATAEGVVAHVMDRVSAGDIIIQHCNSWADSAALPQIVRGIRGAGLEVGSISDVVKRADRPLPGNVTPADVVVSRIVLQASPGSVPLRH